MNELKLMSEFREVLAGYKPSKAAQKTLDDIKLVLFLAPTAGGRNTIMYKLLETGEYYFIVSDTTRQPRVNDGIPEQHGREYWFRSEDGFLEDLEKGVFLEAEIIHGQQVSGTSVREMEKARKLNKIAIDEVDIGGVANILKAKPDTIIVLVLPPSFEEWQRRVNSRGVMDSGEQRRRFETAAKVYELAMNKTYKTVINDNLDKAVKTVDDLVRSGIEDKEQQELGHKLAAQLYKETMAHLEIN